jgi:hypothetical protein
MVVVVVVDVVVVVELVVLVVAQGSPAQSVHVSVAAHVAALPPTLSHRL